MFYVGKGLGRRIDAHEKEARRGARSRKCDRIREIEAAGLRVLKRKVKFFAEEFAAYQYEAVMVENMRDSLLNEAPGGFGGRAGFVANPEHLRKEAELKVLMVAMTCKAGLFDGKGQWAQALAKAMAKRADEFIEKLRPRVDTQALKMAFRARGVHLVTTD